MKTKDLITSLIWLKAPRGYRINIRAVQAEAHACIYDGQVEYP